MILWSSKCSVPFNAMTLLVGWWERHLVCKKTCCNYPWSSFREPSPIWYISEKEKCLKKHSAFACSWVTSTKRQYLRNVPITSCSGQFTLWSDTCHCGLIRHHTGICTDRRNCFCGLLYLQWQNTTDCPYYSVTILVIMELCDYAHA